MFKQTKLGRILNYLLYDESINDEYLSRMASEIRDNHYERINEFNKQLSDELKKFMKDPDLKKFETIYDNYEKNLIEILKT